MQGREATQLQCSALAMAFFSLGLHMARHELDVLWVAGSFLLVYLVDGVVAQGLLWSCCVDFFSLCSSYLHCKWATLEELEKDPRISQKIKRFRNKQAQMKHIFTEVRAECSAWLLSSPAQLGPVLWLSKPQQCPEHPWCHWRRYRQSDRCHLLGTANPGSLARWKEGST